MYIIFCVILLRNMSLSLVKTTKMHVNANLYYRFVCAANRPSVLPVVSLPKHIWLAVSVSTLL